MTGKQSTDISPIKNVYVQLVRKVTSAWKFFLLPQFLSSTLSNLWESPVAIQQRDAFLLIVWNPCNVEASLE